MLKTYACFEGDVVLCQSPSNNLFFKVKLRPSLSHAELNSLPSLSFRTYTFDGTCSLTIQVKICVVLDGDAHHFSRWCWTAASAGGNRPYRFNLGKADFKAEDVVRAGYSWWSRYYCVTYIAAIQWSHFQNSWNFCKNVQTLWLLHQYASLH